MRPCVLFKPNVPDPGRLHPVKCRVATAVSIAPTPRGDRRPCARRDSFADAQRYVPGAAARGTTRSSEWVALRRPQRSPIASPGRLRSMDQVREIERKSKSGRCGAGARGSTATSARSVSLSEEIQGRLRKITARTTVVRRPSTQIARKSEGRLCCWLPCAACALPGLIMWAAAAGSATLNPATPAAAGEAGEAGAAAVCRLWQPRPARARSSRAPAHTRARTAGRGRRCCVFSSVLTRHSPPH